MYDSISYKYNSYMYSGITSGRVLDGELLYTKILEVNLFAFAYRLFHRDFSPINGAYIEISLQSTGHMHKYVMCSVSGSVTFM